MYFFCRCRNFLHGFYFLVVYEHKSRLEKALTGDREACTKKMEGKNFLCSLFRIFTVFFSEAATNLKTAKEAGEKSEVRNNFDLASHLESSFFRL